MAQQRERPYFWATGLSRLLVGENSCEWAGWFRSHYRGWGKAPSDFNSAEWMLNHTDLVNKRKAHWGEIGYDVAVEDQNRFTLEGATAILAGKPDLIVHQDGAAVIIDAKTGHDKPSHIVQVMIYMYAIPRALKRYRNVQFKGQVTYQDHTVEVPAEAVNDQFVEKLGVLIRHLASDTPPQRVPSAQECRFCDISSADCPERVVESQQPEAGTTTDF